MTKPDLQGLEPLLDILCDTFLPVQPDGTNSWKYFFNIRKANKHLPGGYYTKLIRYLFEILTNAEDLRRLINSFDFVEKVLEAEQCEALPSQPDTPSP